MSGFSSSQKCPICEGEMETYSDYKPIDNVGGQCLHCGFTYYTKMEQMSLAETNDLRKEYNENYQGEKDFEPLKPLKRKEYLEFKKEINSF